MYIGSSKGSKKREYKKYWWDVCAEVAFCR